MCETLLLWGEETGRQLVGHRFSYFSSPFEVWQFSTWLFTTALLETWQIANQQPELNAKVKLRRLCVIQSQQGIQTSRHGYYFVSFVVLLLSCVFSFSCHKSPGMSLFALNSSSFKRSTFMQKKESCKTKANDISLKPKMPTSKLQHKFRYWRLWWFVLLQTAAAH